MVFEGLSYLDEAGRNCLDQGSRAEIVEKRKMVIVAEQKIARIVELNCSASLSHPHNWRGMPGPGGRLAVFRLRQRRSKPWSLFSDAERSP
jgi:hypothetical protein